MKPNSLVIPALLIGVLTGCGQHGQSSQAALPLAPESMQMTARISDRFLSYNVEMVEVTGGRFWAPYINGEPAKGEDRYEYRPPIDLTDMRLIKMAAALAPAYVRFSGTWANATWFADSDEAPVKPPAGFDAVLTREQWRKAVAFADSVDAEILTSLATSAGARDESGIWQPDNAEQLIAYTRSLGRRIAGIEFANEANMIGLTQPPEGYTPADFRRDYAIFYHWLKQSSPETIVLATGAVEMGEPMSTMAYLFGGETFKPDQLLDKDSPQPDEFSFHYYGASSQRCHIPLLGSQPSDAYDPDFFAGIDDGIRAAKALRDRYAPAASLWITESGETACGGNPWATTFADVFRFLDQLGRSARQGVQVFAHNTLAASDYALLDEHTFAPRPDYWAAWLWRNLMGTTVLDPGADAASSNIYAHCNRGIPGAVTVLAINPDQDAAKRISVDFPGERYTLTQAAGYSHGAALNGVTLELLEGDSLPELAGKYFTPGEITLEPASVSFLVFTQLSNAACR
ncbi:hypothetical protein [Haliea sp. E17]|uniref:hypothetical protein n=1 Tax=Haliea sp. E17 TaxID=3401576 RepID=UPI003AAB6114